MRILGAILLTALATGAGQSDSKSWRRVDGARLAAEAARYAPEVVAALRDPDPKIRRRAAVALREMDAPDDDLRKEDAEGDAARRAVSIAGLAAAARDPDAETREEAMRSLIVISRIRAWEYHGEPKIRPRDLRPLFGLGDAAFDRLVEILKTEENALYGARVAAIEALVRLKSPRTFAALLALITRLDGYPLSRAMFVAAKSDDPRAVRSIVKRMARELANVRDRPGVEELATVRGEAVLEVVRQLATQSDPNVRVVLAQALETIADPRATEGLVAALVDADEGVRAAAASALGAYPAEAVTSPLLRAANDGTPGVRASALTALVRLGAAPAFTTLAQALADPDLAVRVAATGIAEIDGGRALPLLLPLVEDPEIGDVVLEALVGIRDRRAMPTVLATLRRSPRLNVIAGRTISPFSVAARTATQMGWVEAIPILIERMLARDLEHYNARVALARFGKAAVEPLLRAFPVTGEAREAFVEALAATGDPRAVDRLLALLEDPSMRRAAIEALGCLSDTRAVEPILARLTDPEDRVAMTAAEALGRLKAKRAVEPLLKAMSRAGVRNFAAAALARIGDVRAIPVLLAFTAEDRMSSRDAVEAMGEFHHPLIVKRLIDLLEDGPYLDAPAAEALGRLGDPAALPALAVAAEQGDMDLACAARDAITEISRHSLRK